MAFLKHDFYQRLETVGNIFKFMKLERKDLNWPLQANRPITVAETHVHTGATSVDVNQDFFCSSCPLRYNNTNNEKTNEISGHLKQGIATD